MPAPDVSVVVATYNRASRLDRVLGCLAKQTYEGPFEVILVDDASTDTTPDVLARAASWVPFDLRTIRLDHNQGPGGARNAGWRAAAGPLVAFTDDDCMPTPEWLAGLVGALQRLDIAQGRTIIDPEHVSEIGPFGHTVEVLGETGFYETCNIGYRRDVLERLGGFDESFGYYAEDTDLAWRGRAMGATTGFVDDAVVHHEVRPSDFVAHLQQLRRRGGVVHAIKRHPELRRNYTAGLFFSPTHPWAVAWAASAVAVVRRPTRLLPWLALAASTTQFARTTMRVRQSPARRRQWAGVLPLALAADIAEVALLAGASVRHRTLFV